MFGFGRVLAIIVGVDVGRLFGGASEIFEQRSPVETLLSHRLQQIVPQRGASIPVTGWRWKGRCYHLGDYVDFGRALG